MKRNIKKIEKSVHMLTQKKKVAAYARVSSGKDAMLHSLSAQISYYSELIQNRPEWQYAGVYADEAVSGTKDARPEFQKLIADCKAKKVDMIITKSISRFARNTLTMLEIVRELKNISVDVYFEKENIHSMSGDGELMLTILSSFAQEESLSVSENCKWRIRDKFKKGELANLTFMFGYDIKRGKVSVNADEARVVRHIFDSYINGKGTTEIARSVEKMRVKTRFNGDWTPKKIIHMLNNEKYTGNAMLQKKFVFDHLTKKIKYNNGQLPRFYAQNTHPAIVDIETFKKAQEILKMNYKKMQHKTPTTSRYAFSGLIKCENCGKSYRRKASKTSTSWCCATYLTQGRSSCPSKNIPEETLISLIKSALRIKEIDNSIKEKIKAITVSKTGKVIFEMHDGSRVERTFRNDEGRGYYDGHAQNCQDNYSNAEHVHKRTKFNAMQP